MPRNFWPLNPTAGVEARNSAPADAIVFRKDHTRPGGGLFLATTRTAIALGEDMPDGTLVVPDVPNVYGQPSSSVPAPIQDTVVVSNETTRVGPDGPGWARNPSASGMPQPPLPIPHTTPMLVDGRDTSSTMSNMNPNMPSGERGDSPYGMPMFNTAQDQSADPASYAAGGFVVPIPNYQHPYYVPDHSHYNQLPGPSPPLPPSHGRRE